MRKVNSFFSLQLRKEGRVGGGGGGGAYVWHQVSQKFKTEIGPGLKQKSLSV